MGKQKKKQGEKKTAKNFGKKEKMLNDACRTYQLSRPDKVGAVMALIRECQPRTIDEWEAWYFEHAKTQPNKNARKKHSSKITRESLEELGERLYAKITEVVIPEWTQVFNSLTREDCIDYIYNLTINRTYDGYLREKSVVNELAKIFPDLQFEESDPELDHAGDVDYIARVGEHAIGIQIKPITAQGNPGGYSLTERMQASFKDFKESFGGEVFIVFSKDGKDGKDVKIADPEVIEAIRQEIDRFSTL